MKEHLSESAARTVVIAQIEDVEAVDAIEAIAAVDGIDALFIGRIDLTVALGASSSDDRQVIDAVERIIAVAREVGRPVGMFVPRNRDVADWRAKGVSLFLQGSDHSLLRTGVAALRADVEG